jgi:pantothenate kinase type III
MPLLNDIKATLKADVDVTEMNKYLQAYIQEEVKTGVANALVTLVEDIVNNKTEEAELRITEKLKEEVKKCVTNALPTLVEDIVNNKTEEAELRITEKLQGNAFPFSNL